MSEFQGQKRQALSLLQRLAELADACGSHRNARQVRESAMVRLEEERFHLVFVGEFNHGKTSLVNALIGEPVLSTGATPTTAVTHWVEHGSERSAALIRRGGGEAPLAFGELASYRVSPGTKESGDVDALRVRLPAPFLNGGLVLVDTPGINELNEERADVAYRELPRADAVVVCLDATQALKQSERTFLERRVPPSLRSKLWFVLNKADVLDGEERKEVVDFVHKELVEWLPRPRVFPLSAKRALEAAEGDPGVASFRDAVLASLGEDRGRALLDGALHAGEDFARTLLQNLLAQQQALSLDQETLAARLATLEETLTDGAQAMAVKQQHLRDALGQVKGRVAGELEHFSSSFAEAVVGEVAAASAEDLRRYLPGFLEERIKQEAERQAEQVVASLHRVAEDALAFVDEENQNHIQALRQVVGEGAHELDLSVNTLPYDLGVFALGATGLTVMAVSNALVGGALALAAPVLAVVFRGRRDQMLKDQAGVLAPQAVREATAALQGSFAERIDQFREALFAYLDGVQGRTVESTKEVVTAVLRSKEEGDAALSELEQTNQATLEQLRTLQEDFGAARKALWAPATEA